MDKKPCSDINLLVDIIFLVVTFIMGIITISVVSILSLFLFAISLVCFIILIYQIYLRLSCKNEQSYAPYKEHITTEEWNINESRINPQHPEIHIPEINERLSMKYGYSRKRDKYGNVTLSMRTLNIVPWILALIISLICTIACILGIINNNTKNIAELIALIIIAIVLVMVCLFFIYNLIDIIKIKVNTKSKKSKRSKLFTFLSMLFIILLLSLFVYSGYAIITKSFNEKIFLSIFILIMVDGFLAFIAQSIQASIGYKEYADKQHKEKNDL